MMFQVEDKFFGINEKEPRRLAVLAERLPWYKVGLESPWVRNNLQMFCERKQLRADVRDLKSRLDAAQVELAEVKRSYESLKSAYEGISGSACWKLTKPVRFVLDCAKALSRKAGR